MPTYEEPGRGIGSLAGRKWKRAITYRETAPHEYIVRDWETDGQELRDFDRFIIMIRRFGYADIYRRVRHIYWVIE